MYHWLVRDSAGELYFVTTVNSGTEEVYEVFGKVVLGMDQENMDTGNVDIDIFAIPQTLVGEVSKVSFPEGE